MGNPFVHIELNTQDAGAAKTFYGQLFDWTLTDVPMGDGVVYTMINVGEGTGGGLWQSPVPNVPSFWLAYVGVADIHAATARARDLGATVMREPMEVMGAGWLSIIVDPTGATLGLWQAKAK